LASPRRTEALEVAVATFDLRECLNAISDVVNWRPSPLREYDQIFMKSADMLLQAEHISQHFNGRRVVFVGDGDAMGLCLIHLHGLGLVETGPQKIHVLDFDERVVLSVRSFADRFGISEQITSELYNVALPLPKEHWRAFEGFYANPPFGASNGGRSVEAFLRRGFEATGDDAVGGIVIADHHSYPWTQKVLRTTQKLVLAEGFLIAELLPEFHHYHLDDAPDLTSCSMVVRRTRKTEPSYSSDVLEAELLDNFYGEEAPLVVKYVRDLTGGGKLTSNDHRIEPLERAK